MHRLSINQLCILTHIYSRLPLPNVGPCFKSHFTVLAAKLMLAVTTHDADRCVPKVSIRCNFRSFQLPAVV